MKYGGSIVCDDLELLLISGSPLEMERCDWFDSCINKSKGGGEV